MNRTNMTYLFSSAILISLLLIGCLKPNTSDFQEKAIHIQGILIAGESLQTIKIQEFESDFINDAEVKIGNNQTCFDLVLIEPGVYQSQGDLIIYPDSSYNLEVTWGGKKMTSSTKIPSVISWINIDNVLINIDTSNTGQQVFTASWEAEGDFSYILSLINQEDEPEVIDYPVTPFSFENTYGLPINNSSILLQDLFFTHYGAYKFTVFSIDSTYQNVFFYQPQIQQIQPESGLDNIDGAFGVFVGANKLSVDLMVN